MFNEFKKLNKTFMENSLDVNIDTEQLKNLTSIADPPNFDINDYSNDDPEVEPLPDFHTIYGATVDGRLLNSLVSDIDWFHTLCVINYSMPDNTSPGVAKIIDSLITTGKYKVENEYYKISAELKLLEKTYQITVSPLFYSKEAFELHGFESEITSESEMHRINGMKQIFLKFPRTEN